MITNWWGNQILVTLSIHGAWVGLHQANPTVLADPSTEIVGGGYIRQLSTITASGSKAVATGDKLIFPALPVCTITHISLNTMQTTGGTMYCYVELGTPVPIAASSHYVIPAGDLAFSL